MSDITLTITEEEPISLKIVEAALKPEQEKSVDPTYESQTVFPDAGCVLSAVHVGSIPDPTDEITITENGDYNVSRIGTAHVDVPQGVFPTGTKEITANGTGIDVEQYAAVDVDVPQGVFPTGTKEITENGTGIDVTNYAAVDVDVPGIVPTGTKQISITQNGTTVHDVTEYAAAEIITDVNTDPEKGLVFGDYDSDGYPHSARFVGAWTEIPDRFLYYSQYYNTSILGKITQYIIPNGVTKIGRGSFQNVYYATEIIMPHNPITIENTSFHSCANIKVYHFYDDVTINATQAFDGNAALERVVFDKNVNAITNQCFRNANNLSLIDFSQCTAIPPLYSVASLGHANGCVIKIPSALSDTTLGVGNGWESATNWSALTNIVWEVV